MKKLAELQSRIDTLFKGNNANGIMYTNIEDVMKKVNPIMKELKLSSVDRILPLGELTPMSRTSKHGNVTQMFLGHANYEIDIIDTETGEKETFSMAGSSWMDNPSAVYGSISTYNSRYLWSKILRVAFSTEKEVEEQPSFTQNSINHPTPPGKWTTGYMDAGTNVGTSTPVTITEPQLKLVNTLISKTGTDREAVKANYKVTSLKDLNKGQASQVIDTLQKRLEEGGK